MQDRDSLHQFLFEQFPVRGHIVHLDATWAALLEHRTYPAEIRDTLGEAVAASVKPKAVPENLKPVQAALTEAVASAAATGQRKEALKRKKVTPS